MRRSSLLALLILFCSQTVHVRAGDWPQFRYDAGRTAASPHELPADLQLRWMWILPIPKPAFPGELRLAYDACYEPVILGGTMFVPSMVTDTVTALDTETGNLRWRFFAEGPVRFAPVAWEDKVYFVSDDGYLYCVSADDGALCWKFRGLAEGKDDRKVFGHDRLISLWPARGGPVLTDGVVYFAAGLWPNEGIFVHAVNARTGKAVWSNVDCGNIPKSNWDHGVGFVSGLTPQGYLTIVGEQLVIPCGAQLPAFLDLRTGKLQTYTMGWGGRNGLPKGCWFVSGAGKHLSHAGDLYDIERPTEEQSQDLKPGKVDFKPMMYPGGWTRLITDQANRRELDYLRQSVITPEVMYESNEGIKARDLTSYTVQKIQREPSNRKSENEKMADSFGGVFNNLWELPLELDVHIKAGRRLYVGGPGVVKAIDTACQDPNVVWSTEIDGMPHRMLAADDKLFVVTTDGKILAFAAPQAGSVKTHTTSKVPFSAADTWTGKTAAVLDATEQRDGYALVLGIDRGRMIEELIRQSNLYVIAVDDDPNKVNAVRDRLFGMGLYGTRASVLTGNPVSYPFSPYMANLVVSETPDVLNRVGDEVLTRSVFHALRPYGGVAIIQDSLADRERIEQIVDNEAFHGASVQEVNRLVLLARSGALPGASDWSHAEADAASTGASQDDFIRSPMAVLWFDASRRWHKYPGQVQIRVAGGRLVLLEEDILQASDVYTGRKLWQVESPFTDITLADREHREAMRYMRHRQWAPSPSIPRTAQLVVLEDAICLSDDTTCRVFDPATGRRTGHIDLPEDVNGPWSNLRVYGDYLIGSGGENILCVDRRSGKLLWREKTTRSALSLAVGNGKVFCSELLDKRRGEVEPGENSLYAIDLATHKRLWHGVGGGEVRYSPSLDLVVTDSCFYRGDNGESLPWNPDSPERIFVKAKGLPSAQMPGLIAGDKLLASEGSTLSVYEIPSAAPVGKTMKWNRRGCTGVRASKHLVTIRYCGNSAWIDLDNGNITPLLGIRPACEANNNLYPANGVLNIPSFTAGCTCNYMPLSTACVPVSVLRRGSDG